jgi:Skp family chaperone for outer membrane proteins
MGFKDLIAKLDDVLGEHDKGKSLKYKELKRLEQELEKKQAKYRHRLNSGSSEETPAQTEVRLRVVEAQLAKLRELVAEASL